MRPLFLVLIFLVLTISVFAQNDTASRKPQTKIEQMALKEGAVIKKEFHDLGNINGVQVDLLTVTEVNGDQSITLKGVKFSTYSSLGSSSYERSSYIDADEINGVLKFVDFVRQINIMPEVYTEYVYNSKGDFKAATYTAKKFGSNKLSGDWVLVVYGDKYYSSSAKYIPQKYINDFYTILTRAKDLLN